MSIALLIRSLFLLCCLAVNGGNSRDSRTFVNYHISHSGGTLICKLAAANGAFVIGRRNCNHKGDGGVDPIYRNCTQRQKEIELLKRRSYGGHSHVFTAVERGLLEGELCPHIHRYLLFMRNPMDVMNSVLSVNVNRNHTKSVGWFMQHLAKGMQDTESDRVHSFWDMHRVRGVKAYDKLPQYTPKIFRLDNFFTRSLSNNGSVFFSPILSIGKDHMNLATKVMDSFDMVITDHDMEQFPRQVDEAMQSIEGLHWNTSISQFGRRTNSHGQHRLNSSEIKFLRWINRFDMELYEHAKQLFRQKHLTRPRWIKE